MDRLRGLDDDLLLRLTGVLLFLRGGTGEYLLGEIDPEDDLRLRTGDLDFLLVNFDLLTGVLDLFTLLFGDLDPLCDDLEEFDLLEEERDLCLRPLELGLFLLRLKDGLLVGDDELSSDFDGV